jgi:hypothetical protein
MAHPFKPYEVQILQTLVAHEFSRDHLMQLLEGASTPEVEYTNYGFFVSVKHPAIAKARRVYTGPMTLRGNFGAHSAGFIVFLEDDELTLKTFPWDGESLPATFRDSAVQVVYEVPAEKA